MLLENRKNGDTGLRHINDLARRTRETCVCIINYHLHVADSIEKCNRKRSWHADDLIGCFLDEIFRIEISEALGIREIARKNFSDKNHRVDSAKNIHIPLN